MDLDTPCFKLKLGIISTWPVLTYILIRSEDFELHIYFQKLCITNHCEAPSKWNALMRYKIKGINALRKQGSGMNLKFKSKETSKEVNSIEPDYKYLFLRSNFIRR